MAMYYTCWDDEVGGCGIVHSSLEAVNACRKKHGNFSKLLAPFTGNRKAVDSLCRDATVVGRVYDKYGLHVVPRLDDDPWYDAPKLRAIWKAGNGSPTVEDLPLDLRRWACFHLNRRENFDDYRPWADRWTDEPEASLAWVREYPTGTHVRLGWLACWELLSLSAARWNINWSQDISKKRGFKRRAYRLGRIARGLANIRMLLGEHEWDRLQKLKVKTGQQSQPEPQPEPNATWPEPQPEPQPASKPEPVSTADSKAASVLSELLGVEDMEKRITQAVLDTVASSAAISREVVHRWPDKTTTTVEGHTHPCFEVMLKAVKGGVTRVLAWGAPGLGKTHAVRQLADLLGLRCFMQTPVADQYQLMGYKDANGDYHESEIYRWATSPEPAVLLLDEVDGCHPSAVLALNALLENGSGVFPTGEVQIDPRKIVIATANTDLGGATAQHNARMRQDAAFRDRFAMHLEWTFDEASEEIIAQIKSGLSGEELKGIVAASRKVRDNIKGCGIELAWSPRRTFAAAKLVAAGMQSRDALLYAGLSGLDSQQRERAMKGVK